MRKLLFLTVVATLSCNGDITGLEPPSDPTTETFAASVGVDLATMTQSGGVWYKDVTVGTGAADTATTDSVTINYVGRLKDGSQFDANNSITFSVGGVITGVRVGMYGMKEGGKRKIVIPSALGYGAQAQRDTAGKVSIPRQSTLVFDVDMLKVFNDTTTSPPALRKP